jgi:hypothetical protein
VPVRAVTSAVAAVLQLVQVFDYCCLVVLVSIAVTIRFAANKAIN